MGIFSKYLDGKSCFDEEITHKHSYDIIDAVSNILVCNGFMNSNVFPTDTRMSWYSTLTL